MAAAAQGSCVKTLRVDLDGETVLVMLWSEGLASVHSCDPLVLADVLSWIDRGVVEFVRDEDGGLTERRTCAVDPLFLDRIAESLRGQFGYVTRVSEDACR